MTQIVILPLEILVNVSTETLDCHRYARAHTHTNTNTRTHTPGHIMKTKAQHEHIIKMDTQFVFLIAWRAGSASLRLIKLTSSFWLLGREEAATPGRMFVWKKEAEGKQFCLLALLNQFVHLDYQLEFD